MYSPYIENGFHGNVPYLQGIGNICFLLADQSNASMTNFLVAIVHIKPAYSNFCPKIGWHGNKH